MFRYLNLIAENSEVKNMMIKSNYEVRGKQYKNYSSNTIIILGVIICLMEIITILKKLHYI